MSTSSYWTSENGDRDNVFIERVKSYSPITKTVQVLDSPGPRSPASPGPGYQSMMWTTEPQIIQEAASPGPYTQGTIRRYIVQAPEQEIQPYTQGTIRRYVVQNPEQEVQAGTVRRYIVQNPEQEVQAGTVRRYIVQNPDQSYLQGVNYLPSNQVIYEKTIRRSATPDVERQTRIVRESSVSSVNDQQVSEQNHTSRISVQSTEEVISEQNVQQNYQTRITAPPEVVKTEEVQRRSSSVSGPEQLDARYFGELLAELSRKNTDLYNVLLQHVERMGTRKPSDSEYQEDIESSIPKGVSELTKQQIRYLLQMRQTSDKSMRLVLATFSSLREELGHLQEDLTRLETGKKSVERDLAFKDEQLKEYEAMLASLREKNRLQQQELRDGQQKLRSMEESMMALRNAENDKDYRLKELEYARNTLQQENKTLRVQVTETVSSPVLQAKTDEMSRHYKEMLESLREEKDKEIRTLRTQISRFQQDVSAREGSSSDLQMRLLELTASLEERDAQLKRQQEELFRLRQQQQQNQGGKSVTQEVITSRYSTQYPILRLLNDYKETPSFSGQQTFVVERQESWKPETTRGRLVSGSSASGLFVR